MKLDFCAVCGSKDDLHLHHIDPIIHTGENRKSVKYDNTKPIKDCTLKEIFNALFDRGFISEHATLTLCSWHHRIMHGVVTFQKNNSGELIRAGMYLAQKNGVKLGRKKVFTETQAQELSQKRKEGTPIKDLMNQYSMSRATIYRALASKY
jgi:hypothetical protein